MKSVKELLDIRKRIKNKKPDFIRQDAHKKKKLYKKWRRPKGLHSKMRLKLKGRSKKLSAGYRSPKITRFLHKSGLKQDMIRSMNDLEGLDIKKNGLIISSSFGNKKKLDILKEAIKRGFTILNIKNPEDHIKNIEDHFSLKKKEKEIQKKIVKTEKKEKKLTETVKEGDNKKIEKREKDKLLTKKST